MLWLPTNPNAGFSKSGILVQSAAVRQIEYGIPLRRTKNSSACVTQSQFNSSVYSVDIYVQIIASSDILRNSNLVFINSWKLMGERNIPSSETRADSNWIYQCPDKHRKLASESKHIPCRVKSSATITMHI